MKAFLPDVNVLLALADIPLAAGPTEVDQVEIFRRGDEIVLRERPASAVAIFDALASLPEDFMSDGRGDTSPQQRESF